MSFEEAKSFLLKSGPNGESLYDHISDCLLKVLEERPEDPLQVFDDLSKEVKQAKMSETKQPESEEPHLVDHVNAHMSQTTLSFFQKPEAELDEEGYPIEPAEVNDGTMPDLLDQMAHFNQHGEGLPAEETFRLNLALKKLLESNPLQTVRFFGKIYGTQNHYYVAEGEYKDGMGMEDDASEPDETESLPEPSPPRAEEDSDNENEESDDEDNDESPQEAPIPLPRALEGVPGMMDKAEQWAENRRALIMKDAEEAEDPVGKPVPEEIKVPREGRELNSCNQYCYWVCKHLGEAWERLPDVTPEQLQSSKLIKKFLTGDLNAPVSEGCPLFPGKELHYLRCQIARIAHATTIMPQKLATGVEDTETEAGDDEPVGFDLSELRRIGGWCHRRTAINEQGRGVPFKDASDEETEDGDEADEESMPSLFAPLSEDNPIADVPAWSLRTLGVLAETHAPVLLRSSYWPGAATVAYGTKDFASIYIGYGQKYTGKPYTPPPPPQVQEECDDLEEQEDPTVDQEREVEDMIQERKDAQGRPDDEEEEEEDEY